MISKCGVPDQHFLVSECGNVIADDLGGLRRYNGADGLANFVQRAESGV